MQNLLELVVGINGFLWGNFLMILLVGTGIYFTFLLRFIQIRKFKEGLRRITGNFTLTGEKANEEGMSSFQALATAIAAQVGTGNLAGAATAVASGGPGAIFWMWLSAFFGMATIYAEAVLAQIFKRKVGDTVSGGPAFYIEAAFKNKSLAKGLAIFFAVACILALGFMGNAVQSNSIGEAFNKAFGVSPLIVGIITAILAGVVFFGGIGRIASVTEKIVPIMAGLYIVACIVVLVMNISKLPGAIATIFYAAFNPQAALGGALGITVKQSIRYGVSRGLFSNEAGMGSTPHAHAIAKVNHPAEQGVVAIVTVFIDTFVVLTGTALVLVTSGITGSTGITFTQLAFKSTMGEFGGSFIAICLFFFAFSTIIGWYFFGEANVRYLFGTENSIKVYKILVMFMIVLGSALKVELVWELADMFNALMVLPNLLAILLISHLVKENMDEFEMMNKDINKK